MDDQEAEVRQISDTYNTSKRSRLSPLTEQVSTSGVANDEDVNNELQEQIKNEENKKMDLFLNDNCTSVVENDEDLNNDLQEQMNDIQEQINNEEVKQMDLFLNENSDEPVDLNTNDNNGKIILIIFLGNFKVFCVIF